VITVPVSRGRYSDWAVVALDTVIGCAKGPGDIFSSLVIESIPRSCGTGAICLAISRRVVHDEPSERADSHRDSDEYALRCRDRLGRGSSLGSWHL